MQAFGEKVSHVEIGSDISDAQCFALDPLANSKVASVDVLDAVMAASVASFAARASEAARVCSRVLED